MGRLVEAREFKKQYEDACMNEPYKARYLIYNELEQAFFAKKGRKKYKNYGVFRKCLSIMRKNERKKVKRL